MIRKEWIWDTRNTDNLEPHVQSSRVKCAREKCAVCVRAVRCSLHTSRRVHACCFWLNSKSVKQSARPQWKGRSQCWSGLRRVSPVAISTSLTLIPPILVLPPMRAPFLPLMVQDDELHHVGLGDQLEDDDDDGCWRSELCGSAKYSAQWKLGHSKNCVATFKVRKINFTNSNTLVGVATDRGARYLWHARMYRTKKNDKNASKKKKRKKQNKEKRIKKERKITKWKTNSKKKSKIKWKTFKNQKTHKKIKRSNEKKSQKWKKSNKLRKNIFC